MRLSGLPSASVITVYCERMAKIANRYRIGPRCGRLLIRTRREGLAARAGHDLTIEALDWSGEVVSGQEGGSTADLTVRVELDKLSAREGTGGAMPLSDRDRSDINATMRRMLAGGDTTVFTGSATTTTNDTGIIDGTLSVRGVERPLRLQVTRTGPDRYLATASIIQSSYGIRPYSGFLGALKVRDEVEVEAEVDLSAAERETA
jgi:polyisoprenoid-binding protein YceI